MSDWLTIEEIKIKNMNVFKNSSDIIVVTGPNNSGKSTLLREIGQSCSRFQKEKTKESMKIIENIKIKVPANQDQYNEFLRFLQKDIRFSGQEDGCYLRSIGFQNIGNDNDRTYIN
ncbi:MAG: hypothetical protein L0H53_11745, partial [Candidatus Nitrosocosmicus sp.]|nr:hypothetical protein [Candidatus Nitrosocosmicus sp.]